MTFRFVSGAIELDEAAQTIFVAGDKVAAPPKIFQLILLLLRNHRRVVAKEELSNHLWNKVHVSESSLRWLLKEARKLLGDSGRRQQYIETRRTQGLKWIAPVECIPSAWRPPPEPPQLLAAPLRSSEDLNRRLSECVTTARRGHGSAVLYRPSHGRVKEALAELQAHAQREGFAFAPGSRDARSGRFRPWMRLFDALLDEAPRGSGGFRLNAEPDNTDDCLRYFVEAQKSIRLICGHRGPTVLVPVMTTTPDIGSMLLLRSMAEYLSDLPVVIVGLIAPESGMSLKAVQNPARPAVPAAQLRPLSEAW